jgi:4-amino-4-deoxychorismate lyase
MCRFVESIQLKEGQFKRLELHQLRLQKAMNDFYPNARAIDLDDTLKHTSSPVGGLFKCRVIYDSKVRLVEFIPYTLREIYSLKLVETNLESMPYKTEDRSGLNEAFAKRGDCDDVLLVKNGFLSDTSYANIALFDGQQWFTPRIPLLSGVNRAQLLSEGKMMEKDIKPEELGNFRLITLFNAMIEFRDIEMEISAIYR